MIFPRCFHTGTATGLCLMPTFADKSSHIPGKHLYDQKCHFSITL